MLHKFSGHRPDLTGPVVSLFCCLVTMMTVTLQLHNQINAESDEVVIHKEEEQIDIFSGYKTNCKYSNLKWS